MAEATVDTLDRSAATPSLSASSDMPVIDLKNALPDMTEDAPAKPVDEAAKTDDAAETSSRDEGEGTDAPDETSGEGKDVPPWVKARITREANKRRAAEEQAAKVTSESQAEIERLKAQIPKPVDPRAKPRPEREAYTDPKTYEAALLAWNAEQVRVSTLEEAEQTRLRDERVRSQEATLTTFKERQDSFKADHPDFEQVAFREDLKISPAMSQAILMADDGPAIAYHLGQHPEEAERIAALSPIQAVYEIGKISLRLTAPVPRPKPEPIRPLGSRSASTVKSPDEMSMAEYAAFRAKAN